MSDEDPQELTAPFGFRICSQTVLVTLKLLAGVNRWVANSDLILSSIGQGHNDCDARPLVPSIKTPLTYRYCNRAPLLGSVYPVRPSM